jgi:hypothetical protein
MTMLPVFNRESPTSRNVPAMLTHRQCEYVRTINIVIFHASTPVDWKTSQKIGYKKTGQAFARPVFSNFN